MVSWKRLKTKILMDIDSIPAITSQVKIVSYKTLNIFYSITYSLHSLLVTSVQDVWLKKQHPWDGNDSHEYQYCLHQLLYVGRTERKRWTKWWWISKTKFMSDEVELFGSTSAVFHYNCTHVHKLIMLNVGIFDNSFVPKILLWKVKTISIFQKVIW